MRIKRLSALIISGMLVCAVPAPVMASSAESVVEEILESNEIDSLLSDPEKAVEVILYVKELIDIQDISEEDISGTVDQAADYFGISLTQEDKDSLVNIAVKIKDMDIDEEELRSQVSYVYDKLNVLGVEKEDVKNILEKAVDFVKSLF